MVRDASADLDIVLRDSFAVRLVVDVFYDGERTYVNLPVTGWDLSWDIETATKSDGTLTVVETDDAGRSLVPKGWADVLAPYGQEVAVLAKISFGPTFTETVMLGRFRINGTPQAVDDYFGFDGRPYVSGSVISTQIGDRLTGTARAGFRWPGVPTFTASTWDELQFLTGLPLDANLTDKATPSNLVYPPGANGRLAAVQQLMSYLGGIPVTNSLGELTAVPFTPGDVVNTVTMGTRGLVISVSSAMDASTLVNEVVGTYQDAKGNPIYAYAYISSGPLATDGPMGRAMAEDSADTVTTTAAAYTRVVTVLNQYLQGQTNRITCTVIFDPRTEIGDVVTVQGPQARRADRTLSDPLWVLTGRVVSIHWAGGSTDDQRGLMTITFDVLTSDMSGSISVGP